MNTTLPTPPPREDGLCLTCLGPRGAMPKVLVKRTAHDLKAALALDPFCSSTCARAYYGTSLPEVSSKSGPRAKRVGPPRQAGPLVHGTEHGYNHHGCRCDRCRDASSAARWHRRNAVQARA